MDDLLKQVKELLEKHDPSVRVDEYTPPAREEEDEPDSPPPN
jgi:hypothetical protein